MARKYIERDIPPVKPKEKADFITQVRTYKLITPLFGGGAEPQKPDAITTVRGSEVRGHLRFWWRATRGGMFDGDLQKMKKAEEKIWGSAAKEGKPGPSPVKISINKLTVKKGNSFQAVNRRGDRINNIGDPNSKDGYVAFPLRDSATPTVQENVGFDLLIQYPKELEGKVNIKEEVEDAIWAWETFGGIGARTRRGFGALQLTHINGNPVQSSNKQTTKKEIVKKLSRYATENNKWIKGVPHLTSRNTRYKFVETSNDISAWRLLTQKLKDFRQSFRDRDRNGGNYGRSKWPEPDQIRRETGEYIHPGHAPRHLVQKFPRAKFGLPIVFEFKEADVNAGDPRKTMLQGAIISENKYIERLASPIILRPIACSDGTLGLALVLEWEKLNASDEQFIPPGGLLLKGETKDYFPLKSDLTASEAHNIPPLDGEPDVLQAFLNYLDH